MSKVFKARDISKTNVSVIDFRPEEVSQGDLKSYQVFQNLFENKNVDTSSHFVIDNSTRQILADDKTEALLVEKKIKDGVSAELSRVESFAYKEGFDQGYKDGMSKATEENRELVGSYINNLEKIFEGLKEAKYIILKQNEKEIINILTLLLKKMIHRFVDLDRELVKRTIFDLLKSTAGSQEIKIKLNPRDYALTEEIKREALSQFKIKGDLVVEAFESVEPGGCIIETDFGTIDAQISIKLENLDELVKEMLAQ